MRNPNCRKCSLYKSCTNPCIWGIGNPQAKIMLIGEAPGCFPAGTFVYTPTGGVPIEQLKVGDSVISSIGSVQQIKKTFVKDTQKLIKLSIYGGYHIFATPEHPILVVPHKKCSSSDHGPHCFPCYRQKCREKNYKEYTKVWKELKNIVIGDDWVLVPKIKLPEIEHKFDLSKLQEKQNYRNLSDTIELTEDLAYLLGWFMAEGHIPKKEYISKKDVPYSVWFSLGKNDTQHTTQLTKIIKRIFNLDAKVHEYTLKIHSRRVAQFFYNLFGNSRAPFKRIPHEIFTSSKKVKSAFLLGWYLGDGNHPKKDSGQRMIDTSSQLAQLDAVTLFLSLDILPTVATSPVKGKIVGPRQIKFNYDNYSVSIRNHDIKKLCWNVSTHDRTARKVYWEDDQYFYLKTTKLEEITNTTQVYNIETMDNTYCTPIVVHNSNEDFRGTPFVGKAGQKLNEILTAAGLQRDDLYISNTLKCRPPDNRTPTPDEIAACCDYLEEEIAAVKPTVLVPMGNTAMQYILGVTGVTKYAGSEVKSEKYNCMVIPAFHPSYILRVPEHTQIAIAHFRKIKVVAGGTTTKTPVKYIVADTWAKVEKLFERLRGVSIFAMDIETTGFNFLKDKILCMSFSWRENTAVLLPLLGDKQRQIWDDVQVKAIHDELTPILEGPVRKILQNGAFDLKFIKTWGATVQNFVFDTMLAHHLVDENAKGFHGLKNLALLYTDMGDYAAELTQIQAQLQGEESKRRNTLTKEIRKRKDLDDTVKEVMISDIKEAPEEFSFADIPEQILWRYAAADADATFRMYKILEQAIRQEEQQKLWSLPQYRQKSLTRLFNRIVMPQRNILTEMEYRGALLDVEYIDILDKKYAQKIDEITTKFCKSLEVKQAEKVLTLKEAEKVAQRYTGLKTPPKNKTREEYIDHFTKPVEFNLNSPKHLQTLLFGVLKLKPLSVSEKTGEPSTGKDVLDQYAEESPFVATLAENRHLSKFHKTYIVGMKRLMDENGRIHTSYNSHGTATGRLSSNNPNLQNIPRGSDVKKLFIAPPGYCLVQVDFSQAEFRCIRGDQRVLMEDFTYKAIKDVCVGDKVWSIDEISKNRPRRMRVATVQHVLQQGIKKCVSIKNDSQTIICTPDHKFLRKRGPVASNFDWKSLRTGDACVSLPVRGITNKTSYIKGMIFGLYLTDGHCGKTWQNTLSLNIAQTDKEVLEFIQQVLTKDHFQTHLGDEYLYVQTTAGIERFLKEYGPTTLQTTDYKRGLIAGCLLGDGWFGMGSKLRPQLQVELGLSVLHPEVLEVVNNTLAELSQQFDFTYRAVNVPIREDKEQKPFYHFMLSSNAMLVFPLLIPGRKAVKFSQRLQQLKNVGSLKKSTVTVTPLEGEYETYDLTTSTGTFICEDYLVHNCWADYSNDARMLKDIRNGLDIHKQTAADFWKIPLEQVTKEQRNQAKFVVFGLMYGRGAKSVARQVGISEKEAEGIIKYFFDKYPVAAQWLKSTRQFCKNYGYVVNFFGRIRRLPTIFSNETQVIAEAERQAVNAPIQSAAADLTGIAIIRTANIIKQHNLDCYPILTVHDSIIFECNVNEAEKFVKLIYPEIVKGVTGLKVKIDVEVEVGPNWLELKKVETT